MLKRGQCRCVYYRYTIGFSVNMYLVKKSIHLLFILICKKNFQISLRNSNYVPNICFIYFKIKKNIDYLDPKRVTFPSFLPPRRGCEFPLLALSRYILMFS